MRCLCHMLQFFALIFISFPFHLVTVTIIDTFVHLEFNRVKFFSIGKIFLISFGIYFQFPARSPLLLCTDYNEWPAIPSYLFDASIYNSKYFKNTKPLTYQIKVLKVLQRKQKHSLLTTYKSLVDSYRIKILFV